MSADLVSLKATMDSLDARDQLFRVSLQCYLDALNGVEEHVLRAFAEKLAERAPSLDPQKRDLARNPRKDTFEAARIHLASRLKEASEMVKNRLAGTLELGEVLRLLAQATSGLRTHTQRTVDRMTGIGQGLEEATRLEDVGEFRRRVRGQLVRLNSMIEEMREENRQLVSGLETEMAAYRKQLDDAERRANLDALTGLPNRRCFEANLETFFNSATPFCLLLLDLTRFKAINDAYGHLVGDEVLRAFSDKVRSIIRKEDLAARWGGDEFVVVLPCGLKDAIVRSRQFEEKLSGFYMIRVEDTTHRLRVGVAIGIAEHRTGDTVAQLLARADALLYAAKSER
jgi:diguanylate cyclase